MVTAKKVYIRHMGGNKLPIHTQVLSSTRRLLDHPRRVLEIVLSELTSKKQPFKYQNKTAPDLLEEAPWCYLIQLTKVHYIRPNLLPFYLKVLGSVLDPDKFIQLSINTEEDYWEERKEILDDIESVNRIKVERSERTCWLYTINCGKLHTLDISYYEWVTL